MPDRRRYARTPDTLLVLAVCAATSAATFIVGRPPASLVATAGQVVAMVWCALTALSSLVALVGVLWRDELVGWLLELSGRLGLTFLLSAYATVLLVRLSSPASLLVVTLVAAIAAASGWRAWQLSRRLRTWREAIQEMTP